LNYLTVKALSTVEYFALFYVSNVFLSVFSVSSVRYQGSARQGSRVLVKLPMPPEAKARKIHLFAKDTGWIGKISVDRFSGPTND
jgi:hypothetical protein